MSPELETRGHGTSAPPFALRPARPEDAAALTALAIAAKRHWGYGDELIELWRQELTFTPGSIAAREVTVAESHGRPVGVFSLSISEHTAQLEDLWVLPEAQGAGLGRTLFGEAVTRARAAGARRLQVISDPYAEGFYRRMGAQRIGTVPSRPSGRELPKLELALATRMKDAKIHAEIDMKADMKADMEPIDAETFSTRLATLCLRTQLPGLPRRPRDRAILLKSITLLVDPDRRYTQRELDDVLETWLAGVGRRLESDHVALRRYLVDAGFLRRRTDGTDYRREPNDRLSVRFAPEVDALDPHAIISAGLAAIEARKLAARRRAGA